MLEGWIKDEVRPHVWRKGVFELHAQWTPASAFTVTLSNHICYTSLRYRRLDDFKKDDYIKMLTALKKRTMQHFDDGMI